MFSSHSLFRVFALLALPAVMLMVGSSLNAQAEPTADETASLAQIPPKWKVTGLPSADCGGHLNCHRSSPAIADMNNDGVADIVLATNNGHIMAFRSQGSQGVKLWDRDISPYFGMAANSEEIISSPAVADIDRDGRPEVVIGVGTANSNKCTQGGVIVLEHDGSVKPGWPFRTRDTGVPPVGCTDTVFSTPALGDLDNNGDLEIVFGSFDKGLYVLHHTGQTDPCFPINSALSLRLDWANLKAHLADTIWSSAALADVTGNGRLDILMGSDEGNFDSRFPNNSSNWSCPYQSPFTQGYCGGSLYGITGNAQLIPGFPKYILETIQSTPAVADVNSDGKPEIFTGTGRFYNTFSPDHPTNGFRVFGWNSQGQDLPGWSGGKVVGGTVPASPVIGDIAGDSKPETIVGAYDGKLYAWHSNGSAVAGFPMTPRTQTGDSTKPDVGMSYALGDYDGDNKMEIFFNQGGAVTIVDGNGQQLTSSNFPGDGKPLYYAEGLLLNNPAIGDVDGDGQLELVVHNSGLYVWDLPNGARNATWPMFKHDPARTSNYNLPVQQQLVDLQSFLAAPNAGNQAYLPIVRKADGSTQFVSLCRG